MTWIDYLITLHRAKDAAYGDAWCRRGEAAGIFPNIARKYDRWERITDELASTGDTSGQQKAVVEPLDDTLADLCIYAVKYALWLQQRHPDLPRTPADGHAPQLASVNEGLHAVAAYSASPLPEQLLRDAFNELEQSFLEGEPSTSVGTERGAARRAAAAWQLARQSWTLLQPLRVPSQVAPEPNAGPTAANSPSVAVPVSIPTLTVLAEDLLTQLLPHLAQRPGPVLLLGQTGDAVQLAAQLRGLGLQQLLLGITDPGEPLALFGNEHLPWSEVRQHDPAYLVICHDRDKETLLRSYLQIRRANSPLPTVVVGGMDHFTYHDTGFAESDAPALVPSYATGYPYTRVHMFQHLQAAARAGLTGAIVEFGAFKGGTSAWLARTARQLGLDVPVLAFDSWDGFPPRRSLLDMYEHPRCVFRDLPAVRNYLEPLGVQLVEGDISETAVQLANTQILLGFIDTDNYSPAHAALTAIADQVVPGGAIVFDHFTTTLDYLYTLGERMAGQDVLRDKNFMHVHGSGVFVRLPEPGTAKAGQAV
jgi:predicted O-methyltransferase YrrM